MSNNFQSLLYPGLNPVKKRSSISFDDLYSLFQVYRSIHGHLRVPQKYVLPEGDDRYPSAYWGFKLGAQLNSIYTTATWTKEGHKERLIELGILPQEDQRYIHLSAADVAVALRCYQRIFGDVNSMPINFHIPLEESIFPASLRGVQLGEVLDSIRNRRLFFNYENLKRWKSLDIEFFSELTDYQFNLLHDAFVAFKANHNTVNVPTEFVVPEGDPSYPSHLWGYKLGNQSHNIRSQGTWVRGIYRRPLIELGVIPPPIDCAHSPEDIYFCLKVYVENVHADVQQMPVDFCIPLTQPNAFPANMWGVKLGEIVESIRKRELYFDCVNAKKWRGLGILFEKKKFKASINQSSNKQSAANGDGERATKRSRNNDPQSDGQALSSSSTATVTHSPLFPTF